MYDPQYTKTFYDAYGEAEWDRLEKTAYGRLKAIIHADFIHRHIKSGDRVLDAGSGPGRFSIELARRDARVTVLDISPKQLTIARQKIAEAALLEKIEQFIEADIANLSTFSGGSFDAVMCFGGALSYVCDQRQKAAQELVRVTRPGGIILVSVMSLLGACLMGVHMPAMSILRNPDASTPENPGLWKPLDTGDLYFYSGRARMNHAPMHLYTAEELKLLFAGCQVLESAASNVTTYEGSTSLEQIAADPQAWDTVVELERRLNSDPGLVNSGSHIIMALRKQVVVH